MRRGWCGKNRDLKARSTGRSSPVVMPTSSSSEATEVPSLQSDTEPRAARRATLVNTPGLRSSSPFGERTSDGVDGGKRKWVPTPDGTGGAL